MTSSLPCLCASLRRASRALTQVYDAAFRPLGLRATQFTVLQALSLAGEISQGALGRMLAMDSTTLTRTLRILQRHGWIEQRPGLDRRARLVRLAKAGERELQRALPRWKTVQDLLHQSLGQARWRELLYGTNELTDVLTKSTNETE